MARTKREANTDRAYRLRRFLENGEETDRGGKKKEGELFSPDYVNYAPWHREPRQLSKTGKETFKPSSLFSEYNLKVEDTIEEGDKVVVRWRLRGTWSQPFLGIKPTNKPIEVTGVNVYRFEGDKIVESTGEFGLASFAQQALAAGVTARQCQQAMVSLARVNPPGILTGGGAGPIVTGPNG